MEDREVQSSPQIYARIGGVLYLIIIVVGLFGEAFVRIKLIVWGDPAATTEKIISSELLWRVGIAGELFMLIGDDLTADEIAEQFTIQSIVDFIQHRQGGA